MLHKLRHFTAALALLLTVACAAAPTVPTMFGEWDVTSIAGVDVVEGSPVFLRFSEDGTVSGNAGVNRLRGSWIIEDELFKVGPLGVTKMAGPAMLMDQEANLLTAIEKVNRFDVVGGDLVLSDAGGAEVVRAAPRTVPE
ncbi:MAG: heat shock protein HslJ [Paracoccaceae bacterium]|jgi:heat shock protein HslJ